MGFIDLFLFEFDGVSLFDADFVVDFRTDDDIFRDGVLFDLQGVFFPFFAKTFGAFAAFLFVIVIVSGDVAWWLLIPFALLGFAWKNTDMNAT